MKHIRFKFTIADEIVEVDLYTHLDPDEVAELPGDPGEYSTGLVDGEMWACKLTGVKELIEMNPMRFLGRGN